MNSWIKTQLYYAKFTIHIFFLTHRYIYILQKGEVCPELTHGLAKGSETSGQPCVSVFMHLWVCVCVRMSAFRCKVCDTLFSSCSRCEKEARTGDTGPQGRQRNDHSCGPFTHTQKHAHFLTLSLKDLSFILIYFWPETFYSSLSEFRTFYSPFFDW